MSTACQVCIRHGVRDIADLLQLRLMSYAFLECVYHNATLIVNFLIVYHLSALFYHSTYVH